MRHKIKTNRLGRFSSLRKATLNSLSRSLIQSQSIITTYHKAKAAAPQIEHLITLAKKGTLSGKRTAFKILLDHKLVSKLFGEIAGLFKNRNSGFTRILKSSIRRGDGAQLAIFELTEKTKKEKKEPKTQKAVNVKEQPQTKEDIHPVADSQEDKLPHVVKEEKHKAPQKERPPKKFLGGLRGLFKKERDSL